MAIFTGSGVAIITPFHEDGSINYDQLKKLVDYHCENGTDSIVICGTTGAVVDSQGRVVPRSKNHLKFSVTGPAEIIATDNGDATSLLPVSYTHL